MSRVHVPAAGSDDPFAASLSAYLSASPFHPTPGVQPPSPWHRPFRAQDLPSLDLSTPLTSSEITSNRSLAIHRVLLNIYEQTMLFLPQRELADADLRALGAFYAPELVAAGHALRPELERAAFAFLEDEIEATGSWTAAQLADYVVDVIARHEATPIELVAAIEASPDPAAAARGLLVQMAPDFLSEASAMARATPGNFGPVQSELMKVFIDEYGYGVHGKKHSTLFESCCRSVGLSPELHAYYFHYLPSSLALANYFHYICANKALWFRYLGALYYTEATIPHVNRALSRLLRRVFGGDRVGGDRVDTAYFDEHVHIDQHHRRMVLEDIILPTLATHGTSVIPEILLGFESFRRLQALADQDYLDQLAFADGLRARAAGHAPAAPAPATVGAPLELDEPAGELSYSHIHDHDELFTVEGGRLELWAGLEPVVLAAGDAIEIPAGRLHGSRVLSERCRYRVQRTHR